MGKLTDYNYGKLEERIEYSLQHTKDEFYEELKQIKGPTLITAVGGSMVAAIFLSKVLEQKNKIICLVEELDQVEAHSPKLFQNLIVVSASGKNHGVKEILKKNFQKKYIVTMNKQKKKDITLLNYEVLDKEESFISLANTLLPIANLVKYYTEKELVPNRNKKNLSLNNNPNLDFEVFYDETSKTTANFLESTFIEAGLGNLITHDKYSYCHGRSTLASKRNSNAIYLLSRKKDIDTCLLENIPLLYENVFLLESKETDSILIDYDLLKQAYGLVYELAKILKRDLSKVKYAKIVPKIYHYKGSL